MDLDLSDEQQLFVDTTRKLLASEVPMPVVRALEDDPAGFANTYWRRGAELGWTGMLVSEADGGGSLSGQGLVDLALVAEEMGRSVAPGPLVPVNLVASAVSEGGTAEQKSAVLPSLLSGEATGAWTGPDAVEAEADGEGGLVLRGVASPVEAGAQAAHLLVVARSPEGHSHVLVDPASQGVTVTPLEGLDLVRRFAEVRLDGAAVPASALVGPLGGASREVGRLGEVACVLQCAEMAGAAARMFEGTLEYLGHRYSFGRPLASYQALKHRLADDKMWLEASHAIVSAAARAVAARDADCGELASAAKAWVGPHATELIQDCVQLHGGIGVTWEHDLHLYLRRATVDRVTYGGVDDHLDRVADAFLGVAS